MSLRTRTKPIGSLRIINNTSLEISSVPGVFCFLRGGAAFRNSSFVKTPVGRSAGMEKRGGRAGWPTGRLHGRLHHDDVPRCRPRLTADGRSWLLRWCCCAGAAQGLQLGLQQPLDQVGRLGACCCWRVARGMFRRLHPPHLHRRIWMMENSRETKEDIGKTS